MRLERIKLAGFKSFVDPTAVQFPGNLTGVVGPNGCGKSNIIDAVRWVMGESSARYLRGESIVDVIFNGSGNRSPAGHASIELHFDNSDGRLGGAYQQYSEIVIRRQVNLEGQSVYYLNGAVCRRRDITDIFLGTGLGPRSYAIIEQGTISRLIEAKPQDLRVYLEEAAGISKYKERRRETELRLGHTRDNLARLNDIREELQKQLNHLSKQAETAEKYQQLKTQEKKLRVEILALRARQMQSEISQHKEDITTLETQLEQHNTEHQSLHTQREIKQQTYSDSHEKLQAIQKEVYEINTEIARIEQKIQHHKEQKQQLEENLSQTIEENHRSEMQLEEENKRLEEFLQHAETLNPELTQSKENYEILNLSVKELEDQFHQAQKNWEEFQHANSLNIQKSQVEQTKIQHIEKQIQQITERLTRFLQEQTTYTQLSLSFDIESIQRQLVTRTAEIQMQEQLLAENQQKLDSIRGAEKNQHQLLDNSRTELHALKGRLASLQALQEAALGKNVVSQQTWLKQNQLDAMPRLAEKLNVQTGFERAVETVLFHQLESICVDRQYFQDILKPLSVLIGDLEFSLSLLEISQEADHSNVYSNQSNSLVSLASVCEAPSTIQKLLSNIYLVENIQQALSQLPLLEKGSSIITKDGCWIGHGFMRVMKLDTEKGNVLLREKALSALSKEIQLKTNEIQESQLQLDEYQEKLKQLERWRQEQQDLLAQTRSKLADLNAQLKVQESQRMQHEQRKAQLQQEIGELEHQKTQEGQALIEAREIWQSALAQLEQDNEKCETLQQTREECRNKLQRRREEFQQQQQLMHTLTTQIQVLEAQQKSSLDLCQRLTSQIQALTQKRIELNKQSENLAPVEAEYQRNLDQHLSQKLIIEEKLQHERSIFSHLENELREFDQQLQSRDELRTQCRFELEQKRINLESVSVARRSLDEKCQELGEQLDTMMETLSEEISQAAHEENLNKTLARIDRLGLINLAAISEHAEQLERKTYLDTQHQDLITALELLEEAIHKIDRETRTRFKETYEKVNGLFQQLFPTIFGGGQAYLELTGNDLLETGVQVIARPPGKRNSTIHLLSGGEKALTAIALVFSIFQLNPAPFCMLDEVDAPLDDANIGRFCNLVKEMSKNVQFIFISHNKIAIEMAEHLIGVTMKEPGVSRLVAVDIKAAMEMAEA